MEEDNLKLYFSLITGEIYEVVESATKKLDDYQIPLLKKPHRSCNKCYGRLHIGFDIKKKIYLLCHKCARKCVDFDNVQEEISVETPTTTNDLQLIEDITDGKI